MAAIKLIHPSAGEHIAVQSAQSSRLVLDFPADQATMERPEGSDSLVFRFDDGSSVELQDFYTQFTKEQMPEFEVEGQLIAGADFFEAFGPDLAPAAGPSGSQATGGGYTEYASAALMDGTNSLDGIDLSFETQGVDASTNQNAGMAEPFVMDNARSVDFAVDPKSQTAEPSRIAEPDYASTTHVAAAPEASVETVDPITQAIADPSPFMPMSEPEREAQSTSVIPTQEAEVADVTSVSPIPEEDVAEATPATPTPTPTKDNVSIADPSSIKVYEAGLASGTTPEADGAPSVFEGTLKITAADGVSSATINEIAVITDNVAKVGATVSTTEGVLEITGYDANTQELSYTYTLTQATTHSTQEFDTETQGKGFTLKVRDSDGDVAETLIPVTIVDDAPLLTANDPDTLLHWNGTGYTSETGTLSLNAGADGFASLEVYIDNGNVPARPEVDASQSSGTITLENEGVLRVALVKGEAGDRSDTITYTYTPLNMTSGGSHTFTFIAKDTDGDSAEQTIAVNVERVTPEEILAAYPVADQSIEVSEAYLPTGTTYTDDNSQASTAIQIPEGYELDTTGWIHHKGDDSYTTTTSDGNTLTFANGELSYILTHSYEHTGGEDTSTSAAQVALPLIHSATGTAIESVVHVTVLDDAPTLSVQDSAIELKWDPNACAYETEEGTLSLQAGADGLLGLKVGVDDSEAATLTIAQDDPTKGTITLAGEGVLEVQLGNGGAISYRYVPDAHTTGGEHSFTFQAQDTDGDWSEERNVDVKVVRVTADDLAVTLDGSLQVDEAYLPSDGTHPAGTKYDANTDNSEVSNSTSIIIPEGYSFDAHAWTKNGDSYAKEVIDANNNVKGLLEFTPGSDSAATLTFTLKAHYEHTGEGNGTSITESLTIPLIHDATGTIVPTAVPLTVLDDSPALEAGSSSLQYNYSNISNDPDALIELPAADFTHKFTVQDGQAFVSDWGDHVSVSNCRVEYNENGIPSLVEAPDYEQLKYYSSKLYEHTADYNETDPLHTDDGLKKVGLAVSGKSEKEAKNAGLEEWDANTSEISVIAGSSATLSSQAVVFDLGDKVAYGMEIELGNFRTKESDPTRNDKGAEKARLLFYRGDELVDDILVESIETAEQRNDQVDYNRNYPTITLDSYVDGTGNVVYDLNGVNILNAPQADGYVNGFTKVVVAAVRYETESAGTTQVDNSDFLIRSVKFPTKLESTSEVTITGEVAYNAGADGIDGESPVLFAEDSKGFDAWVNGEQVHVTVSLIDDGTNVVGTTVVGSYECTDEQGNTITKALFKGSLPEAPASVSEGVRVDGADAANAKATFTLEIYDNFKRITEDSDGNQTTTNSYDLLFKTASDNDGDSSEVTSVAITTTSFDVSVVNKAGDTVTQSGKEATIQVTLDTQAFDLDADSVLHLTASGGGLSERSYDLMWDSEHRLFTSTDSTNPLVLQETAPNSGVFEWSESVATAVGLKVSGTLQTSGNAVYTDSDNLNMSLAEARAYIADNVMNSKEIKVQNYGPKGLREIGVYDKSNYINDAYTTYNGQFANKEYDGTQDFAFSVVAADNSTFTLSEPIPDTDPSSNWVTLHCTGGTLESNKNVKVNVAEEAFSIRYNTSTGEYSFVTNDMARTNQETVTVQFTVEVKTADGIVVGEKPVNFVVKPMNDRPELFQVDANGNEVTAVVNSNTGRVLSNESTAIAESLQSTSDSADSSTRYYVIKHGAVNSNTKFAYDSQWMPEGGYSSEERVYNEANLKTWMNDYTTYKSDVVTDNFVEAEMNSCKGFLSLPEGSYAKADSNNTSSTNGQYGKLTVNTETGEFAYEVTGNLEVGETVEDTFSLLVKDAGGTFDIKDVTFRATKNSEDVSDISYQNGSPEVFAKLDALVEQADSGLEDQGQDASDDSGAIAGLAEDGDNQVSEEAAALPEDSNNQALGEADAQADDGDNQAPGEADAQAENGDNQAPGEVVALALDSGESVDQEAEESMLDEGTFLFLHYQDAMGQDTALSGESLEMDGYEFYSIETADPITHSNVESQGETDYDGDSIPYMIAEDLSFDGGISFQTDYSGDEEADSSDVVNVDYVLSLTSIGVSSDLALLDREDTSPSDIMSEAGSSDADALFAYTLPLDPGVENTVREGNA